MTHSKQCRRQTRRTVRMPATRFPHLQKRLRKGLLRATPRIKK